MRPRMHFDDVAWERSEDITDSWVDGIFAEESTLRAIGQFIVTHRRGVPVELGDPKAGYFNILFRMKFQDGGSAIIRFPKPGETMFPEEKVRNEVATIRYIQDHTSIPVPFILHWGTKEESPLGLGPFIIMELSLPRIGSLEQIDDFTYEVACRPHSIHMNELVRLGTLPRSKLPDIVFETSSSYFDALAELHIEHLIHQRNDTVDSAIDCQRKYIARKLFYRLARDRRLTASTQNHDAGPFKLWCNDLRPSNVLLNADLQIVGVIDWEFAYASPAEFSAAPPWWLLLEQPEYWPDGIEAWTELYECRLQTFLKMLVEREDALIQSGRLEEGQRLSGPMWESWRSGDFWVSYAARKNFAFDAIFWQKLDFRFFGSAGAPEDAWEKRIELLDAKEKKFMESLVQRKLEDMKERVLAWEQNE
ncbi:Phosphotransferase enzyme family [Aspergillus sp. HF37]|nr:Phosphotransferase enzyme family [Aspergillus sp. HF37]